MSETGLGLRFKVKIDGFDFGNWEKCDGLTVEYEVKEYSEGGENGDERGAALDHGFTVQGSWLRQFDPEA